MYNENLNSFDRRLGDLVSASNTIHYISAQFVTNQLGSEIPMMIGQSSCRPRKSDKSVAINYNGALATGQVVTI